MRYICTFKINGLKSTFAIDKKWSPILKNIISHIIKSFLQLLAEWWAPKCPLKRL